LHNSCMLIAMPQIAGHIVKTTHKSASFSQTRRLITRLSLSLLSIGGSRVLANDSQPDGRIKAQIEAFRPQIDSFLVPSSGNPYLRDRPVVSREKR